MTLVTEMFGNCFRRSKTGSSSGLQQRTGSGERTRTLVVVKDDNTASFGLTLSGDKPVSVQTVRSGGAADRAGVREKDVIVKVNGEHVTNSTHSEVVDLISGKTQLVCLFLLSSFLPSRHCLQITLE